jgi:hypothetical protein
MLLAIFSLTLDTTHLHTLIHTSTFSAYLWLERHVLNDTWFFNLGPFLYTWDTHSFTKETTSIADLFFSPLPFFSLGVLCSPATKGV